MGVNIANKENTDIFAMFIDPKLKLYRYIYSIYIVYDIYRHDYK